MIGDGSYYGGLPPIELAVLELDTFLELVGESRDHQEAP